VQVGTYGDPANAERAAARLRSLGLPVGFANITRNGQALQVVAAGPFSDVAALRSALNAARSAGYGDAFTRR
jgi:cell division protein FtsN